MLAVTLLLGLAAHSVTTPSHFFGGYSQSYDHPHEQKFHRLRFLGSEAFRLNEGKYPTKI